MAEAERMTLVERLKYLRLIQPRYRQASRRERGRCYRPELEAAGHHPRPLPEPGHFEVERVHHAGVSANGQYVHTLQLLDMATLADLRQATNPLQFRNEVHSLIDRLSRLPNARPGRRP